MNTSENEKRAVLDTIVTKKSMESINDLDRSHD